MALISMTGFGRGAAAARGIKAEVELSSVNRKQLDVRVWLPRGLVSLDSLVYNVIHESVARGNVTGSVKLAMIDSAVAHSATVDEAMARESLRKLRRAAARLGLRDDLTARSLLQLPEVVKRVTPEDDTGKALPLVEKALKQALRSMNDMRRVEGRALERELRRQLRDLKKHLNRIRRRSPELPARYRKTLTARIKDAGVPVNLNDPQLLREVALMADRCDISEEIVRLDSHFEQAQRFMDSERPSGRALDFLCQEMFREINTIGSKANDHLISRHVVQFKAGLECVREQVQNVE